MTNARKLTTTLSKEAELYTNNDRLVEMRLIEIEGDDVVKITVTVTEKVGSKKQHSYNESAHFMVVEDGNKYRRWLRLDEIDDAEINVYQWAENFNRLQKQG